MKSYTINFAGNGEVREILDAPKPPCDALDNSSQKATILFKGILFAFVSASSF